MKKLLTAAFLAGGLIVATATGASAHASQVDFSRICTDDGETQTVVTFDNDYQLTATVTYQWGSESASTVNLAAKQAGSSNPTASLPSHAVGTLKYHVKWSDDFRQPNSGDTSLTIGALTDCHATTTTSTSTTTTTLPPTTTTTLPPTTTTTQPPAVTTVEPAATEQAIVTEVLGVQVARPAPAPVGGVQTGGGGTSESSNHLLPLGAALGLVGLVGVVTMQLRRRIS
jgi:hypothetical protein